MRSGTRTTRAIGAIALLAAVAAAAALALGDADYRIDRYTEVGRLPKISPDYTGIRIPFNIAPLDFVVEEPGRRYQVRFAAGEGEIVVSGTGPEVEIPAGLWRDLLRENRGKKLRIDVFVDPGEGGWTKFETIVDEISADRLDGYLVYRDLYPQFYVKAYMSIKERSLEGFGTRRLIDNLQFPRGGCINCHQFSNYRGDRFVFQVRHEGQNYMVLDNQGEISLIQPVSSKPGSAYLSWHPSGKALAVTVDMDYEIFNVLAGMKPEQMVEYGDTAGNIAVYHIAENTLSTAPAISRDDRVETQPGWSPDGKHLYFVSAPQVGIEDYQDIKYDLRRIGYDLDKDEWGECETLVSAGETGVSCSFPKVSPDGRFLLFCGSDRSSFTILRSRTDLYLMDLADNSWRKLAINSEHTDSYHAWTSNGRWFCFVSKRRDGVHGLVYFCHVDEDGTVSKPLVLPQEDPRFYESFVRTYNAPEFVKEPVAADRFDLGDAATRVENILRSE